MMEALDGITRLMMNLEGEQMVKLQEKLRKLKPMITALSYSKIITAWQHNLLTEKKIFL